MDIWRQIRTKTTNENQNFQNYYSRIVIQIQTRAPGDRERFQNTPMAKTTNENLNFPEVLFLNYDSDSEKGPGKNHQWKSKPCTEVDPSSVIINLVVRLLHDQQQPKFYNLRRYLQYVYIHI